jgi:uncharacterized protein YcsI (UPF0317 family)
MVGVLVGCDKDVATPIPQYRVYVHGPFTPYVSHISKHSSAYIHYKTLSMIHIQHHNIIDHMSHMHK